MAKKFSLGKAEKLKSRKQVEALFASGKSQGCFPLRISYKLEPLAEGETSSFRIGVTASRRNFKRAVDRNRIKRLLREAYRLQKETALAALQQKGLKGFAFFMYVDKTLPSFNTVFETMAKCLKLLQKKIAEHDQRPS